MPTLSPVRSRSILLLLAVSAACGAPGSDSIFTKGNPKATSAEATSAAAASRPPRFEARAYDGYYRRIGDDSQFQPCGTREPIDMFGTSQAQSALKERFRWNAVWEGAKMFAVFQGAIVTDTPATAAGDSVRPGPRTRFFLVSIDSLRTWRSGDCGGMRIP